MEKSIMWFEYTVPGGSGYEEHVDRAIVGSSVQRTSYKILSTALYFLFIYFIFVLFTRKTTYPNF